MISYNANDDSTYEGTVEGSGSGNYSVHVDLEHPRRSTCSSPYANGTKIICKHIVAVYFCIDLSEADSFLNKSDYASEAEEYRAKKYDKFMSYAKHMSQSELREAYAELMLEVDELRLKIKK